MKKYDAVLALLKTYIIAQVVYALMHHFNIDLKGDGVPTSNIGGIDLRSLIGVASPELTRAHVLLGSDNPHKGPKTDTSVADRLGRLLRPFVEEYMVQPLRVTHLTSAVMEQSGGSDDDDDDDYDDDDDDHDHDDDDEDEDEGLDGGEEGELSPDEDSEDELSPSDDSDDDDDGGTRRVRKERGLFQQVAFTKDVNPNPAPNLPQCLGEMAAGRSGGPGEPILVIQAHPDSSAAAARGISYEEQKEPEEDNEAEGKVLPEAGGADELVNTGVPSIRIDHVKQSKWSVGPDDADIEMAVGTSEHEQGAAPRSPPGLPSQPATEGGDVAPVPITVREEAAASPTTPTADTTSGTTRAHQVDRGGYKNHYFHCALALGMLLLCIKEAGHFGDGFRLQVYELFDRLHYRTSRRHKYHWERLVNLVMLTKALPRHVARQAVLGGFVNLRGGAGQNNAVDQFLEHLNKFVQERRIPGRIEAREKARRLVANLCIPIHKLLDVLDRSLNVARRKGAHRQAPLSRDVARAVNAMTQAGMLQPNRRFRSQFKNITDNAWSSLTAEKENKYLRLRRKRLAIKELASGKGEADAVCMIP
jgi:hypothetical protein